MLCEPLVEWTSFPFVERQVVSFLLVLFLIGLSFLVWKIAVIEWGYPIFYYGGMLLTICSLLPYFIETKYKLYDDRIVIKYLILKIERKMSDFGCFYIDKRGIMLGTFKSPRRLDRFRGQSLRFSARQSEKEEVIRILVNRFGKQY